MFEKELLEKDVLNRIRYDKRLNLGGFTVCYMDRFSSRLKEVKYTDLAVDGDYIKIGDSTIPMHRIREIKLKGVVVWAKRRV